MTREEAIRKIHEDEKPMTTPEVAAALIGCRSQMIRIQAEIAPQKLGFPVVRVGNRTKIPKKALLAFCGME